MSSTPLIDQIAERTERLLQRHAELLHSHLQLKQQLQDAHAERDSLKSRLHAARARIDELIDRLQPADTAAHHEDTP